MELMELAIAVIGLLGAQTAILGGIFFKLGGLENRVTNLENNKMEKKYEMVQRTL